MTWYGTAPVTTKIYDMIHQNCSINIAVHMWVCSVCLAAVHVSESVSSAGSALWRAVMSFHWFFECVALVLLIFSFWGASSHEGRSPLTFKQGAARPHVSPRDPLQSGSVRLQLNIYRHDGQALSPKPPSQHESTGSAPDRGAGLSNRKGWHLLQRRSDFLHSHCNRKYTFPHIQCICGYCIL